MSGGNIAYGCADFRNGQIGLVQQAFCLFAADGVVIPKQRVSGFPLEDPGQVISIYKERRSTKSAEAIPERENFCSLCSRIKYPACCARRFPAVILDVSAIADASPEY